MGSTIKGKWHIYIAEKMRTGHQRETIALESLKPLQPPAMVFKFTFSAVSFGVAKTAYCSNIIHIIKRLYVPSILLCEQSRRLRLLFSVRG